MLDNIPNLSVYIPNLLSHIHHQYIDSSDSEDDNNNKNNMPSTSSSHSGTRYITSAMSRQDSLRTRRPRLLRSSATEPSITAVSPTTATTSSSSAIATPSTGGRRATDLLNQVSASSGMSLLSQSPSSLYSEDSMQRRESACEAEDDRLFGSCLDSDHYFSFPSFDTWESDQPEREGEAEK